MRYGRLDMRVQRQPRRVEGTGQEAGPQKETVAMSGRVPEIRLPPLAGMPTVGYFFSTIQMLRNWSGLPWPCNLMGPGVPSAPRREPPVLPGIS